MELCLITFRRQEQSEGPEAARAAAFCSIETKAVAGATAVQNSRAQYDVGRGSALRGAASQAARWCTRTRRLTSAFFLLPSAFCLLLLQACATAPRNLATDIDKLTSEPPFNRATWFIRAEEDNGRVLYSRNDKQLAIPASNRKLFAAATISECLPLDGRLVTEIWRDGDDLVVVGDGDPSLGSWRYERDGDFDSLAAALRSRGITHVRDVVADVSRFDRVIIPGSWKVNYLADSYGAPVDALAWNENTIGPTPVSNPALNASMALRDALILAGVEVTGVARVNIDARPWGEKIAEIDSPFVAQLLATVLKNSQNLYTEMLFKRIAGGTYDAALAEERSLVTREASVDADSFRFVDGSGLAPDDLVAPTATIRLLRWINDPSRRGLWWTLMATPSQEGTLHSRLVELESRLRGKTGTLNGVNALSGIIAMPDGHYRYFSIMVNHHAGDGDEALRIFDSIVRKLAATEPSG